MTPRKNDKLGDLLQEFANMLISVEEVIDFGNRDMPVTSDDAETILGNYLTFYGKQDNRHGGFCTADHYKSFIERAKEFPVLYLEGGAVQIMEKARSNLEISVRALAPNVVSNLGYELRQDDERLLVYQKVD